MDANTFATRVEEHRKALQAYAFACCRDLSLAEDIVQEAIVIAFKKREQYFPEADFSGWLISITRNVWFRERERFQTSQRHTRLLEENADLLFNPEQYSEERLDREREALRHCLKKLPDSERQLIEAHFERNLKYAEIALEMKRTLSWVKVRMFRARNALLGCVQLRLRESEQ